MPSELIVVLVACL